MVTHVAMRSEDIIQRRNCDFSSDYDTTLNVISVSLFGVLKSSP